MTKDEWISNHDNERKHKYTECNCFYDGWVHCKDCGSTPPAELDNPGPTDYCVKCTHSPGSMCHFGATPNCKYADPRRFPKPSVAADPRCPIKGCSYRTCNPKHNHDNHFANDGVFTKCDKDVCGYGCKWKTDIDALTKTYNEKLEIDRWWEVFCASQDAWIKYFQDSIVAHLTDTQLKEKAAACVYASAEMSAHSADAAIAEAKKRGKL